jgi:hypothetical protein
VALDRRLAAIFEAWFDYDHASDEDAKGPAKAKRDDLIEAALKDKNSHATVMDFLRAFANDIFRDLPVDTPAWEPEIPSQVRHEAGAS